MNLKLFSVAVMCAPMLVVASSVDLSGNWNLTSVDGRHKVKAAVPGDNYSALEAAARTLTASE